MDADEVVLVVRAFPIRVAGNSGPLPEETSWMGVQDAGGHNHPIEELTSVTRRTRRVGRFHAGIVRTAIAANNPTRIVLNHVDYVDHRICLSGQLTAQGTEFVRRVERECGRRVDAVGLGPFILREQSAQSVAL